MASIKKTKPNWEKANLCLTKGIKKHGSQLARDLDWSLSELVERLLERELEAQGLIAKKLLSPPVMFIRKPRADESGGAIEPAKA